MTTLTTRLVKKSKTTIIVLFALDLLQITQWSCYHVGTQADVRTASLSYEIIQTTIALAGGEATAVDCFLVVHVFRHNQYTVRCADDVYCLFVQIMMLNYAKHRGEEVN